MKSLVEREMLLKLLKMKGAKVLSQNNPYKHMMADKKNVQIVNGETAAYIQFTLTAQTAIVVKRTATDTAFNCNRRPKHITFRKWVTGTGRDVLHTPFISKKENADFLKRLDDPEFAYDTYSGNCALRITPLTRHAVMNKKIDQITIEPNYQVVLAHPRMLLAHTANVTVTYKRMKFFFWLGGHTEFVYVVIKNKQPTDNAYVWVWSKDGIGPPLEYPLVPYEDDDTDKNLEDISKNQYKSNMLIRNRQWTAMKAPIGWIFTIKRQKFWIKKNHNIFMRIREGWGDIFFTWVNIDEENLRHNDKVIIYNSDVVLYNSHVKKFDKLSFFRSHALRKHKYAQVAKSNLTKAAEISTIAAAIMGGHVALAVSRFETAAHLTS